MLHDRKRWVRLKCSTRVRNHFSDSPIHGHNPIYVNREKRYSALIASKELAVIAVSN